MSAFDTARDLRLPGVVVERAYIDPTAIGTRMRNTAKKMLRQGYTEGGWSSKSKQLALKLSECRNLNVVNRSSYGCLIPGRHTYSDADAANMIELLSAAEAIELMGLSTAGTVRERDTQYIKERYDFARQVVSGTSYTRHRWVTLYNETIKDQVCEAFASTRSAKTLEATETVCKWLDDGTPIEITISR